MYQHILLLMISDVYIDVIKLY